MSDSLLGSSLALSRWPLVVAWLGGCWSTRRCVAAAARRCCRRPGACRRGGLLWLRRSVAERLAAIERHFEALCRLDPQRSVANDADCRAAAAAARQPVGTTRRAPARDVPATAASAFRNWSTPARRWKSAAAGPPTQAEQIQADPRRPGRPDPGHRRLRRDGAGQPQRRGAVQLRRREGGDRALAQLVHCQKLVATADRRRGSARRPAIAPTRSRSPTPKGRSHWYRATAVKLAAEDGRRPADTRGRRRRGRAPRHRRPEGPAEAQRRVRLLGQPRNEDAPGRHQGLRRTAGRRRRRGRRDPRGVPRASSTARPTGCSGWSTTC